MRSTRPLVRSLARTPRLFPLIEPPLEAVPCAASPSSVSSDQMRAAEPTTVVPRSPFSVSPSPPGHVPVFARLCSGCLEARLGWPGQGSQSGRQEAPLGELFEDDVGEGGLLLPRRHGGVEQDLEDIGAHGGGDALVQPEAPSPSPGSLKRP